MNVFAAVDIGSNSVRLKIAQIQRHRLVTILEDRAVTRLGEGVFSGGSLSPASMEATIRALRRFRRSMRKYRVGKFRVVATSALRDARNSAAFRNWIRSELGWEIDVISGLEEGRLIHLGIHENTRITQRSVLLVDLGGGSCELTLSQNGHIRSMDSLPLGAVRLTEQFLAHDPPKKQELARLREFIQKELDSVQKQVRAAKLKLVIATSGTAAALAGGSVRRSPRVTRRKVAQYAEELSTMNTKARAKLPGIGPRRAEIIVAGAWVYRELMERCGLSEFHYSSLGLRDGILAQMLAEADRQAKSGRRTQSVRTDALLATSRKFGVAPAAAQKVAQTVMHLFDSLRRVHRLPLEYRGHLEAAAMLADIGAYVSHSGRFRHSHYLIVNSEIFGFTADERKEVAAICRYMGRSLPNPADREIQALRHPDAADHVLKAVVLLRMARAANLGSSARANILRLRLHGGKLTVISRPGSHADLRLWAIANEKAYFRAAFGRDLAVAAS